MFGRFISILALISPLFFPWQYTVGLVIVASFWYPQVAFAVGLLLDSLYLISGVASFPFASAWGFVAMFVFIALRRFAHTRLVMSS